MRQKGSLIGDLFNMDVLFGILLGIAVPFWVWVAIQANAIREYQELIAGIMALFGAAIAVIAVMHQIRHAREMEEERREWHEYAARKMLSYTPNSLSR